MYVCKPQRVKHGYLRLSCLASWTAFIRRPISSNRDVGALKGETRQDMYCALGSIQCKPRKRKNEISHPNNTDIRLVGEQTSAKHSAAGLLGRRW